MSATSVKILSILLILGNAVFTMQSGLFSLPERRVGIAQHDVIRKRAMPIELRTDLREDNTTSVQVQDINDSNSTVGHDEEAKVIDNSTETVAPSINVTKTTPAHVDKQNLNKNEKSKEAVVTKKADNTSIPDGSIERTENSKNSTKIEAPKTNASSTVVDPTNKNGSVVVQELQIKTMDAGSTAVTMEQVDMLQSQVSPHDDDDVPEKNSEGTAGITNSTSGVQESIPSDNVIPPPVIFPNNSNVKSIENADPELRKKLNHTFYDTKPANENTTTKEEKKKEEVVTSKPVNGSTDLKPNVKSLQVVQDGEANAKTKAVTEKTENNMSSGIIALVTTLTFAVVVIVAYVSIIVWRRYLEYKYGRRELLVNELEFDTNDLRHFEL